MSTEHSEFLARLSSTVLADCAFLLTEPTPSAELPEGDWLHSVVEVHGVQRARLTLSFPRSLAELVAGDMLGALPGDPEAKEQAVGAVAELANVLVGALVERFCAGLSCGIGLPVSYCDTTPVPSAAAETALLLSDSGDLIRVVWTLGPRVSS